MRRRGSGDSWGTAQALGLGEWGSFLAWELVRTGLGAGFTSAAWIRCATLVITLERTKRPRKTQVGEKMLETLTQMPLRATIPSQTLRPASSLWYHPGQPSHSPDGKPRLREHNFSMITQQVGNRVKTQTPVSSRPVSPWPSL